MSSRLGSSQTFTGFFLRVLISIPVWFLSTLILTYVLVKVLTNRDPPILDALLGLNVNRLIEQDFIIGLPLAGLSGFVSLLIVWATFWRSG